MSSQFCEPYDCYALLESKPDASPEDLMRNFRRLSRQMHPDRNIQDPDAPNKYSALTNAYDVLRTVSQRAEYDRYRPTRPFGSMQTWNSSEKAAASAQASFYFWILASAWILGVIALISTVQYRQKRARAWRQARVHLETKDALAIRARQSLVQFDKTQWDKVDRLWLQGGKLRAPVWSESGQITSEVSASGRSSPSPNRSAQRGASTEVNSTDALLLEWQRRIVSLQSGSERLPRWQQDTLLGWLLFLPLTFAQFLSWHLSYSHAMGRQKLDAVFAHDANGALLHEATSRALGWSSDVWADLQPAEQQSLIQQNLWHPQKLQLYLLSVQEQTRQQSQKREQKWIKKNY